MDQHWSPVIEKCAVCDGYKFDFFSKYWRLEQFDLYYGSIRQPNEMKRAKPSDHSLRQKIEYATDWELCDKSFHPPPFLHVKKGFSLGL